MMCDQLYYLPVYIYVLGAVFNKLRTSCTYSCNAYIYVCTYIATAYFSNTKLLC